MFSVERFIEEAEGYIRRTIGKEKAITALSGGVDSMTSATLAARAIPQQCYAIFIDTGLMRKNEKEQVLETSKEVGINIKVIEAEERFLAAIKGVTDPEEKRKRIGELFIQLFEKEAKNLRVTFLIQGTIAPDWIESGGEGRDKIKTHHNVAGLPLHMKLKLCEPLRELYKHEVREVGKALGLPRNIYERQPFPGPGLAVRIIGEVTKEKLDLLRRVSLIVEEEVDVAVSEKKMKRPWQYFAVLLPVKTVGVRGDERAYGYTVMVRIVDSLDGMTANFFHVPYDVLQTISTRITNEIRDVGRVLYDVTNKPPGTIEVE